MGYISDNKFLFNIFGLPGVGKSTLRNAVIEKLGEENCGKIQGDHYLKSKPVDVSFFDYFTSDGYDWELLSKHLSCPIGETIATPLYDYKKFIRISENGSDKKFTIRKINIIDTTYPCLFTNLKILITLDPKERKDRIMKRGRTDYFWKTFVLENWGEIEAKDRAKDKIHQKKADLVLDGRESVEYNVKKVVSLIEKTCLRE